MATQDQLDENLHSPGSIPLPHPEVSEPGVSGAGAEMRHDAQTLLASTREAGSEAVPPSVITWVHIDDVVDVREDTAEQLGDRLGERLGEASSVQEGIELIQRLLEEGKVPRLIILDQQFTYRRGDRVPDDGAARAFVQKLNGLVDSKPEIAAAFAHTVIVMLSGTARDDPQYLPMMQTLSRVRIVSGIGKERDKKGALQVREPLFRVLEESGVMRREA